MAALSSSCSSGAWAKRSSSSSERRAQSSRCSASASKSGIRTTDTLGDQGSLWELRHRDERNPVRVLHRHTPTGPEVVSILAKKDEAHRRRAIAAVIGKRGGAPWDRIGHGPSWSLPRATFPPTSRARVIRHRALTPLLVCPSVSPQ